MHVVIFQFFGGRSFLFPFSCHRLHFSRGKFTGSQGIVSLVVETPATGATPFIGVGSLMLCVTTSTLLVVVTIPDKALLTCQDHFPCKGGGIRALWLDPSKGSPLTGPRILLGPTARPQR